jgi:hypothetical protein
MVWGRHRRWLLFGVLVPAVLVSAVFTISGFVGAQAPDTPAGFDPYIYRADGSPADPVNLIFRGTNSDGVAATVAQVLGWRFIQGSPMSFHLEDTAQPTAWQLGVDLGGGSRLHMRIQSVQDESEPGFVLAAVHQDDTVPCGHIGAKFDKIRDMVAQQFADAGHRVTELKIGNTRTGRHCDGTENGGDGIAVIIDLNE